MYFVDREKIEQTLVYMEGLLAQFSTLDLESNTNKLAFERATHMIIESILDIGNAMIDGFIMRDPGSYEDIIDILLDEKVVQKEEANGLKDIISFRKPLVQQYMEIDHDKLLTSFSRELDNLALFPKRVRDYLENELGPVSAFKN